jgi:hypothetical protein
VPKSKEELNKLKETTIQKLREIVGELAEQNETWWFGLDIALLVEEFEKEDWTILRYGP